MFGSIILEIFLGLAFLFLTLSLVVTTAQEFLAGLMGMRAGSLVHAVRNLLEEDVELANEMLDHPTLRRLYRGKAGSRLRGLMGTGPSYMPNQAFVTALLDTLRRRHSKGDVHPISIEALFDQAPQIARDMPDGPLKVSMMLMLDHLDAVEGAVQERSDAVGKRMSLWFDEAMDRASGWYKRKAQTIGLILAACIVVAVDADALSFMQQLWFDASLRQVIVSAAEEVVAAETVLNSGKSEQLDLLGTFPIGWAEGETLASRFANPAAALRSIVGWMITVLAVSLGAAFWFDLTKKALSLRSSGPKPSPPANP